MLVFHRLGVDVITTVIASWASVELCVSVVGKVSVVNREAAGRASSRIALELSSGRGEDASTTIAVGDLAVVDAVLAVLLIKTGSLSDTVLTVNELTDIAANTT